jgi:hypothetical protein
MEDIKISTINNAIVPNIFIKLILSSNEIIYLNDFSDDKSYSLLNFSSYLLNGLVFLYYKVIAEPPLPS